MSENDPAGLKALAFDMVDSPLALLDGKGRLVAANAAFSRLAEENGETAERFAGSFAQAGPPKGLPFGYRSNRVPIGEQGGVLIELIRVAPIPQPEESTSQPDPLTGLLSRASLDRQLAEWVAEACSKPFALLFLDLDRFKQVNDRSGHLAGDACLREVGARLGAALRSHDVIGRYGGDEFVALVRGATGDATLGPVCDRIRQAIGRPIETPDGPVRLGVSVGGVFSSEPFSTPEEMLREADRRMYQDKPADKGRAEGG